ILGGSLYEGLNELGHTTINYNGILCECGNRGCLETYASIRSILKNTHYQTWTEAVDAEDTVLIEKEAEYLVPALVNVSNLFSLDIIVLASDIAYKSEQLLSILNARVREKSLNQKVSIVKTKITSSIQSAAVIALDKFFHL
ncbi:MAG: ROK family protein, partial [Eubacteriales bacterium]